MSKQLSSPERIVIEQTIHKDYSFASIIGNLKRSASTIAREVLRYRCFTSRIPILGELDCIRRPSCQQNSLCPKVGIHGCCASICDRYESIQCDLLDKPPYVCSNCKMRKNRKKNKAYYSAHKANAAHQKAIKDPHSGIRKTPSELHEIAELIEPLIHKGESLNHICTTHATELGISERTLYNSIDKNVFKIRNIDLPKKVVYRQRRPKRILTKIEYQYRQGRTIEDFNSYIEANPDLSIVGCYAIFLGRGSPFCNIFNNGRLCQVLCAYLPSRLLKVPCLSRRIYSIITLYVVVCKGFLLWCQLHLSSSFTSLYCSTRYFNTSI